MWDKVASLAGGKVFEAVNILGGIHKEVVEINEELEIIQDVINGADRMVATAEQDNKDYMITKLRESALRIEEVTEDYIITEQQQPPRDPGCAAILYATVDFIKTMILRLRISYEIQDIKSSVREIKSSLEQGSGSGSQNEPPQHALRRNALYVEEADVVGFEAPKHVLIGWLNEKQENRTVIAVVGMGGLGKTTLARIVYDRVIGDFDCHAWITMSQDYTIHYLLRTMLKKFGDNRKEVSEMDLESLTEEVRKYLRQKRYVIFFDDVRNKDLWSEIVSLVLDNKNKSRIVITTRSMDIAIVCKRSSIVHILNLKPLSPQQSLDLFYKKAFQGEPNGICPTELEKISLKIVEKCEGLPLAIVAIGGLLATKERNLFEWQKLLQNLNYELDKYPNATGINNILGLGYAALPYYLKSCFLYFGIYPKDYVVKSKKLIRHWIAEGFVKSDERHETLEEVAEQYLKELVQRSLVQASSFSIDGKPKTYRVHNLLRDMILTKIKDLGFCHFVGDDEDDLSMFNGNIRRLQIAPNSNDGHLKVASSIEGSFIRSLHVFRNEGLPEDFVRIIPTKCRRLMVLDFENNPVEYIPNFFWSLIHLRYLNFRNTKVQSLPESIGNLQNLETLDVKLTNVQEMPREITKLRKLRHLLVDELLMIEGVGGLKSLQTLRDVEIGNHGKELETLRQLRVLGLILDEQNYKSAFSSIKKMQHLEKLIIDASEAEESIDWGCLSPMPVLQKLHLEGQIERFSEWIPNHQNLVSLTLRFSNLTDPLNSLIHLPNLLSLTLIMAYGGETLHFKKGEFQKLRKLVLKELHFLDSIHIDEGALSSLEKLALHNIPYFIQVPYGINHLGKLKVFCIDEMPREFVDRVRENVWINNNVSQVTISDGKKVPDFRY